MSSTRTMAGWPKLINSYEEIPGLFQNKTIAKELKDVEFPYMIFIPPFRSGFKKYNPMIIYIHNQSLHIIEKDGKKLETYIIPLENINYIETGTILLNSWVKVSGEIEGMAFYKKFEFNSVAAGLFKIIIDTIRNYNFTSKEALDIEAEKDKFNYLSHIIYKFMTYGRQSLLSGSKVIKLAVQPEITVEKAKVFGKSLKKTLSSSHLCVLTDKELIILKDTDHKFSKYGIISTYIPLQKIVSVSLEGDIQYENLVLNLNFSVNDRISLLFSKDMKGEMSMFLDSAMSQQNLYISKETPAC